MGKKGKVVHTEPYHQGKIEYELRVVSAEGKLWGEWTCKACGQSGASSQAESEQIWAVWSAKMHLSGHHVQDHWGEGGPEKG